MSTISRLLFEDDPHPRSDAGRPLDVEESFSARVPRSSAEVRRAFIHDIKEVEDVGQQEQQGDERDEEERDEVKGEVEEISSQCA